MIEGIQFRILDVETALLPRTDDVSVISATDRPDAIGIQLSRGGDSLNGPTLTVVSINPGACSDENWPARHAALNLAPDLARRKGVSIGAALREIEAICQAQAADVEISLLGLQVSASMRAIAANLWVASAVGADYCVGLAGSHTDVPPLIPAEPQVWEQPIRQVLAVR